MRPPITIDKYGHMPCPLCNEPHTHVDDVFVAGRPREDGAFCPVHVDSDGNVTTHNVDIEFLKTTRRHSIGLVGTCESCEGRFAIEFRQHKGITEVHLYRHRWQEVRDGQDIQSLNIDLVDLEAQFNKGVDDDSF